VGQGISAVAAAARPSGSNSDKEPHWER